MNQQLRIEFYGGPRDGERMIVSSPGPPRITIPLPVEINLNEPPTPLEPIQSRVAYYDRTPIKKNGRTIYKWVA